jgi:hypothetical protein
MRNAITSTGDKLQFEALAMFEAVRRGPQPRECESPLEIRPRFGFRDREWRTGWFVVRVKQAKH